MSKYTVQPPSDVTQKRELSMERLHMLAFPSNLPGTGSAGNAEEIAQTDSGFGVGAKDV